MVLDLVLMSVTIIALLIASYCDWKTREVPDWLSYGLIFAALGVRAIFSFEQGWSVLLEGLFGLAIFFLLALFFYQTRQWGGGDSKLMMGMGAVIGLSLPFGSSSLDLFWFFLSLLFLGSIYGLLWVGYTAIRNRHVFAQKFREKANKKAQISMGLFSLLFMALGLIHSYLWLLGIFPIMIYYLFNFVNAVESSCFIRQVTIDKLTEGDWLAEDVLHNGKILMKRKTLDREDLQKLFELKNEIKAVSIKEGVPFVPGFLLAYLMIIFGQEVFAWVLKTLF